MQFFTYRKEKSEQEARVAAYHMRANTMTILINNYKILEELYHKHSDLRLYDFLNEYYDNLLALNHCNHSTDTMHTHLNNGLAALNQHPEFEDIQFQLNNAMAILDTEKKAAKNRHRTAVQNQQLKIKYHAIYSGIVPVLGIAAGIVMACMSGAMLYTLGIPMTCLLLSQTIYWAYHYKEYQSLAKKLKADDFAIDLGTGLAVKTEEIPESLAAKKRKISPPVSPKKQKGVIISEATDELVEQIVTEGTQLLQETTDKIAMATQSAVTSFWQSFQTTMNHAAKITQDTNPDILKVHFL